MFAEFKFIFPWVTPECVCVAVVLRDLVFKNLLKFPFSLPPKWFNPCLSAVMKTQALWCYRSLGLAAEILFLEAYYRSDFRIQWLFPRCMTGNTRVKRDGEQKCPWFLFYHLLWFGCSWGLSPQASWIRNLVLSNVMWESRSSKR